MGWFTLRSTTELYPVESSAVAAELVALAGADAVVERARAEVTAGDPVIAIAMAEAVLRHRPDDGDPAHRGAVTVMIEAHEALLEAGGDVSFWESGWLHYQLERWRLKERR